MSPIPFLFGPLQGSEFRYEIAVEPTADTVKHLESRAKFYAEEKTLAVLRV